MISIEDLTTPVTYAEAKASFYEALGIVGANTTMWKPGAVYRTIIAAAAILFVVASRLVALIATAGWFELASGAWLTLVARYQYGIERVPATFAEGPIAFTNTAGGNYTAAVGDVVIANPFTGAEYVNLTAFTVTPGSVPTPTVVTLDDDGNPIRFRAREAGEGGTAGIGTITGLVSGLGGGVAVSNDTTALVGLPEQDDVSLRLACKEKLASRTANGPKEAYAAAARGAVRADGTPVGINRVSVNKDGKGNVFLAVATAVGVVPGTLADLTSDLGLVNDNVQRKVAPLSVTAHTASAALLGIPVTYELWMLAGSGLTDAQVVALVNKALTQALATVPIGGFVIDGEPSAVFVDWIRATIKGVRAEIFHVVVTAPGGDILGLGRAPVAGLITATAIHQVEQAVL